MQLGFVIDHTRCIGCHACTVACKSENEVPVGDFRTWVKYTEAGEFPSVKRSFAVLRCNQCTDAPCMEICPTSALGKGVNGIVDIDPKACIGCKSCMHGCPYDALYINEAKGTAEKCHFCAHRVDRGLAPACAVVCPTEAIIPGDFHDPNSRVSRMLETYDLSARKTEAGTGPNVFYREVAEAGIEPEITNLSQGAIWSELPTGPQVDAQKFEAGAHQFRARTVYDVPRKMLWGGKITGYLFAKSIAAGVFPLWVFALAFMGWTDALWPNVSGLLISLVALAATGGLLVGDLKRPDRFFYILIRPNWSSWLAKGTVIITAYAALLSTYLVTTLVMGPPTRTKESLFFWITTLLGGLTAAYTGWLFGQAKGRVLWMKRLYWLHLLVQAALAGAATLAFLHPVIGLGGEALPFLQVVLGIALVLQAGFILLEPHLAPPLRRAEYRRASNLISHGPYAKRHWIQGVLLGVVLPVILLTLFGTSPGALALAGAIALYGLWVEEDVFVRAGQSLPIS